MLAVAYSGGRDSTALLHVAARMAVPLGLRVAALHVHHGLSPQADAWVAQCRQQCERWAAQGLPLDFHCRRLAGQPAPAQSVEAWAREGRHAALSEMARVAGADLLLLAQHRRDQAETFVLQALRGAGAAGLAAMPAAQWRDGLLWARPWLAQPRQAIEAYLQQHRLAHIDDDSNADTRYARNRLRHAVWPALTAAFPAGETGLAQAAAWAQQALDLQRELAAQDLQALADASGLDWQGLTLLSPARAANALRAWLQQALQRPAPASLVQRLLSEGGRAGRGAGWPCEGGQIRCHRGRLSLVPAGAHPAGPALSIDLSRPGLHGVPAWGGAWRVEAVPAGGLPPALLREVRQRARSGGEQFQAGPGRVARSLKKAYQSAGLPAWQREGQPLLFAADGRLLFVPGLGPDARVLAAPGAAQLALCWLSDSVPGSLAGGAVRPQCGG